ncbi:MAG: DUF4091 domain-containing protein [Clostridia bacterium]|nr:DUF4091 domain-containing protein [Clostridia bacterium]
MKTKKIMCIFLTVVMLLSSVPLFAFADDSYMCCLTYSDIQAYQGSGDLRYGTNCNAVDWQKVSRIYLAQNEREAFQVFFYEKGSGKNIKIEVSDFKDGSGNVMKPAVYKEEYFVPEKVTSYSLADALLPYHGEYVEVAANNNMMFYVEIKSDKQQPAGDYKSEVTVYNGETKLSSYEIHATVWNFALPDDHYTTLVTGLYNHNSGYSGTSGFLELNGVRVENGEVIPEDKEKAEEILAGWQEYMLDHGITPYEIPRWLIDEDEGAAALAMADVRRESFSVPVTAWDMYGSKFSPYAQATIEKYKSIVYENKFLKDKAYFYPVDEGNFVDGEGKTPQYDAFVAAMTELWQGYHSLISYNGGVSNDILNNKIIPTTDIACFNNDLVNKNADAMGKYNSDSWYKRIRYIPGDNWTGNTNLWTHNKSCSGIYRKLLFWKQAHFKDSAILLWNCAYFRRKDDGSVYNVWDTHTYPYSNGLQQSNADGAILLPGVPVGESAQTPIATLRFKQIADGIEIYDYIQLAREFVGEECESIINGVIGSATSGMLDWEVVTMNNARIALGNALNAVQTQHNFGEWENAVAAEENHNGLDIRTCADCGVRESRNVYFCDGGNHSYTYTSDGADTHTLSCKYCGYTYNEAHNPVTVPAKEATCSSTGLTEGKKCSLCGQVITAQQTVKKKDHNWGEGKVTSQPTCKAEGVRTFTCRDCPETKTEKIPTVPHSYSHSVVNPTCTEKGYTLHKCALCGSEYKDNYTDATGHVFADGSDTCSVCSKKCSCMCHQTGFMGFLYKIVGFFWKLFGINRVCECGKVHY